jgi:hypothetical protein
VSDNWPAIVREMQAVGIWSQDDAIACAGTIAIETASTFLPIHEYGSPPDWANYDGGAAYAGRGHAQLTHQYNYQSCGNVIGLDLVGTPDLLLTTDPSAKSFAWFYSTHGVPSKDGSHYYTLQELADEGDYYWFRMAWSGGSRGSERMQAIRDNLLGAALPSADLVYIPDVPDSVVLQQNDWTCSVRSTYAALWAIHQVAGGPEPTYGDGGPNDVYAWMVPSICDSSVGLHAADGHELVSLLNSKGYPSTVIPSASLSDAQRVAGTTPALLGGASWYHWVMVRGVHPDGTLILENPAPGYKGIADELRDSWDALGPMTLITVNALAGAPPVPVPVPPATPTFSVGEGLTVKLAAIGDVPASDETFGDLWSECFGVSGVKYLYWKGTGEITMYPPST